MLSPGELRKEVKDYVDCEKGKTSAVLAYDLENDEQSFVKIVEKVRNWGEISEKNLPFFLFEKILEVAQVVDERPLQLLANEVNPKYLEQSLRFRLQFSDYNYSYSNNQLVNLVKSFGSHLKSERDHILRTGLPLHPFRDSLWLDVLMGSFCPLKFTRVATHSKVPIEDLYNAYGEDFYSKCVRCQQRTRNSESFENPTFDLRWGEIIPRQTSVRSKYADVAYHPSLPRNFTKSMEESRKNLFDFRLGLLDHLASCITEGDVVDVFTGFSDLKQKFLRGHYWKSLGEYCLTIGRIDNGSLFGSPFCTHFSNHPGEDDLEFVSTCVTEILTGPSHYTRLQINQMHKVGPLRSYFHLTKLKLDSVFDNIIDEQTNLNKKSMNIMGLLSQTANEPKGSSSKGNIEQARWVLKDALSSATSKGIAEKMETIDLSTIISFTPDQRSCTWRGKQYDVTPMQAEALCLLCRNFPSSLKSDYILETINSKAKRFRDLFKRKGKMSPVWNDLIVRSPSVKFLLVSKCNFQKM